MKVLEFRRTQGIVPFGVGAIIDFPEDSLMAAGLDAWPIQASSTAALPLREATRVSEPRLQARLASKLGRPVTEMFMPPEAPARTGNPFASHTGPVLHAHSPFVRFPEWHFCPRCRAMQRISWNTSASPKETGMLCSNSRFRRKASDTTQPCSALPDRRRPRLVPVRFIQACSNGHISDFPWVAWAHSGHAGCGEETGTLFLVSTGGAGLDGLRVECKCGKGRTMRGAFTPEVFERVSNVKCTGDRPWLGPEGKESCGERVQVVQRGASNVYFPRIVSSILIPPYSETLHRILDNPSVWSDICDSIDGLRINGEPRIEPVMFRSRAARRGIDPEVFAQAVREKYFHAERWDGNVPESDTAYRRTERQAFLGPRPAPEERDEFDLRNIDISKYTEPVSGFFSNVVLLPRLRETRALIGFTRITPYDGTPERLASLSLGRITWVPAVSTSGEGIYFELDVDRLAEWKREHAGIANRAKIINDRARAIAGERGTEFEPIPSNLLLAHTLSHLIIRQLSFDCGYDSSSLKERLYVSDIPGEEMCGILIYTASGDSEGSLGGLVRQGEPGRFEATVDAGVRNAQFCASDPLCLESEGQGYYGMNLAACHACALLPETACELGNRILDRIPIIGSQHEPQSGYFSPFLR